MGRDKIVQDFTKPAVNDENGQCIHCGRDNRGYEGSPCSDECPMYWEELGIPHPSYPDRQVT